MRGLGEAPQAMVQEHLYERLHDWPELSTFQRAMRHRRSLMNPSLAEELACYLDNKERATMQPRSSKTND